MTFSARLDSAITCNGLTRTQVANSCGVTTLTVNKWCDGSASPRCSQLHSLCHLLKTTPNWLVMGDKKTAYYTMPKELMAFLSEIKQLERSVRFQTLVNFHQFFVAVTTNQLTDKNSPFIIPSVELHPDNSLDVSKTTMAERIKQIKNQRKLSNKQIAAHCEVTEKSVYNWYSNNNEPSVAHLRSLAILFETSPNWLMSGYEDLAQWAGMSQESIKAMLDSYENIPHDVLNQLIYHYRKIIHEIQELD